MGSTAPPGSPAGPCHAARRTRARLTKVCCAAPWEEKQTGDALTTRPVGQWGPGRRRLVHSSSGSRPPSRRLSVSECRSVRLPARPLLLPPAPAAECADLHARTFPPP